MERETGEKGCTVNMFASSVKWRCYGM